MKILRVKGAGLASLSAEFDIDLTDAELRSAGLFMISGLTGAGKSTILDAIMLALFDALPRAEGAGADRETGAENRDKFERATASSSILSRGAGDVGARAGQQADVRISGSVSGIVDTGLVPLSVDVNGAIPNVGRAYGVARCMTQRLSQTMSSLGVHRCS